MTDVSNKYVLAAAGAVCGGVIGYLKVQWVVPGLYIILLLLSGGGFMNDTGIYAFIFKAIIAIIVILFMATGAWAGYSSGKLIRSKAITAMVLVLFCLFTAVIWRRHITPTQARQNKAASMHARFYDEEGYYKVTDVVLLLRGDRSGWDVNIKISGHHSGDYSLACSLDQYFKGAGPQSGGMGILFNSLTKVPLAVDQRELTLFIPSKQVAEKYAGEWGQYPGTQPVKTTLEVFLMADLPKNSEYYGPQNQMLEKKQLSVSLKDIGIVQ